MSLIAGNGTAASDQAGFQSAVQPFIARVYDGCQNAKIPSGELNLQTFQSLIPAAPPPAV